MGMSVMGFCDLLIRICTVVINMYTLVYYTNIIITKLHNILHIILTIYI